MVVIDLIYILVAGFILGCFFSFSLWYYIEYKNALRENEGDKE